MVNLVLNCTKYIEVEKNHEMENLFQYTIIILNGHLSRK